MTVHTMLSGPEGMVDLLAGLGVPDPADLVPSPRSECSLPVPERVGMMPELAGCRDFRLTAFLGAPTEQPETDAAAELETLFDDDRFGVWHESGESIVVSLSLARVARACRQNRPLN